MEALTIFPSLCGDNNQMQGLCMSAFLFTIYPFIYLFQINCIPNACVKIYKVMNLKL